MADDRLAFENRPDGKLPPASEGGLNRKVVVLGPLARSGWGPGRARLWVGLLLLAKLLHFVFFLTFFAPRAPDTVAGFWGASTNDTFGYLQPVENALAAGSPLPIFGYRAFGYALPYLAFRFVAPQAVAMNAMLVLQMVLSALSVYALALLAYRLFDSEAAFRVTLLTYFALPTVSYYDVVALTESLAASTLVLSLYFLLGRWPNPGGALAAGGWLAWCCFLKPVALPLAALYLVYMVVRRVGQAALRAEAALLLAPLIVGECVWTVGRLANGATQVHEYASADVIDPAKHTMAMYEFLKALGEDFQQDLWMYSSAPDVRTGCAVVTSQFDCDTLDQLRRAAQRAQRSLYDLNPDTPRAEAVALNQTINSDLRRYTNSIRQERPFHYYVVAPTRSFGRLVTLSITYRLFGEDATMNPSLRPARRLADGVFWILELGCLVALLWKGTDPRSREERSVVLGVTAYFYLVYPLVFGMSDGRYLIPVLPLLVLLTAGHGVWIWGSTPARAAASPVGDPG